MAETLHDTFVIEHAFPKSPARVFKAFSDAAQKARWYADRDFQSGPRHEQDFRVGGVEKTQSVMGENTPFPGVILASEGVFQDIVEGERIVQAATMTLGERRISSALMTFAFEADGAGTRLILTHQAAFYEGSDGPEMRRGGWQALLEALARTLADA
jgi:uncharacterized protein YndB with AHSA1/START domain